MDPSSAYDLFEEQTGHQPAANRAGVAAAFGFLILVVLLLATLTQAADLRQFAVAFAVLVAANVLGALIWMARSARRAPH